METTDNLKEQKERTIIIEQRGIKNSNDITELSMRTKSNTHRIDKIEDVITEIKKETASLGELGQILKVQTEINVTQTKHMEKLDDMLSATTNNLTELKFMSQRLQDNHENTEKNLEKLTAKFEKESEEGKISSNKIVMMVVTGLISGGVGLVLSYLKFSGM